MLFADSPRKRMVHRVGETMGPFDGDLLKMHEAEVHFLSDSVPCLGKSAMASPEIKFTERRKEHVEYNKDAAKRIDRAQIQFRFHSWCQDERDGAQHRFDKVKEKRNLSSSSSFHGTMNEIPISSPGTERKWCSISSRRGQKCSLLLEVQAWILHVHGSTFRKDLELEKISR